MRTPAEKARRRAELTEQRGKETTSHRAKRRPTNEEASRALEKQISIWREQFEQGDREKLLACFVFCVQTQMPIPSWVTKALAGIFDKWLQAQGTRCPTLDSLIRGQRTGRHARSEQRNIDRHNQQLSREAVELVEYIGVEGEQRFIEAAKLIEKYRRKFGGVSGELDNPAAVKSLYFKAKKVRLPRNHQIWAELGAVVDPASLPAPAVFLDDTMKDDGLLRPGPPWTVE